MDITEILIMLLLIGILICVIIVFLYLIIRKFIKSRKVKIITTTETITDVKGKTRTIEECYPKKEKRFLATILCENHRTLWIWIPFKRKGFIANGNYYFVVPKSIYLSINNVLSSTYLEGISLPISHEFIKRKTVTRTIETDEGKYDVQVQEIDGLKFDSQLIYMLLTRRLADIFTKVKNDIAPVVIIILLIIAMVLIAISIGVHWVKV